MKADTPSSVDQSPSAVVTGRGRGKAPTRKRKPKNPKTPPANTQAQPTLQQLQQTQQTTPQQINSNPMNQMQMNMQVNYCRN